MKSRIYILDLELKLRSLTTILLTCSHESLWIDSWKLCNLAFFIFNYLVGTKGEWDIILYIWDNLTSSN